MTHEYAKEIHQFIRDKIEVSEYARRQAESAGNQQISIYHQGRLEKLKVIRKLLNESYELTTQRYE